MDKLIRGIIEFRQQHLPALAGRFKELAKDGQSPDVLFFACSDSRVEPSLIVSTDPGDLFMVRSVGNLVAPASYGGISVGDVSEASAIEFAVQVLGVRHVVVCGHSGCGAMKAALAGREKLVNAPNLAAWLEHADAAKIRLETSSFIDPTLPPEDRLSQANVLAQLDHVASFADVRELAEAEKLKLHAWWFEVATGDVYVFDQDRGGYILLDEAEAERVLAGNSAFSVGRIR
jgi:carbonic anhydrase